MTGSERLKREPGIIAFLTGVLVRPKATLAILGRGGRAWSAVPALLMVVVTILMVVAYSHADCQYVHRLELEHYRNTGSQTSRPPVAPTPLPITMAIRTGGRLVSMFGSWIVWAAALYLLAVLFGENEVSFRAMWNLILWTSIPYAIRGALQSGWMAALKKPIYNQALSGLVVDRTQPPPMTFQYVIPTRQELALASLLGRLDIYLLWHLALVVLGLTVLTTFSRRKAAAVTLGIWVVFTLVAMVPHFFPATFGRFRYF
jgi:hypothetical protein